MANRAGGSHDLLDARKTPRRSLVCLRWPSGFDPPGHRGGGYMSRLSRLYRGPLTCVLRSTEVQPETRHRLGVTVLCALIIRRCIVPSCRLLGIGSEFRPHLPNFPLLHSVVGYSELLVL